MWKKYNIFEMRFQRKDTFSDWNKRKQLQINYWIIKSYQTSKTFFYDFNQIDPVCAIRLFRRLNHACQV